MIETQKGRGTLNKNYHVISLASDQSEIDLGASCNALNIEWSASANKICKVKYKREEKQRKYTVTSMNTNLHYCVQYIQNLCKGWSQSWIFLPAFLKQIHKQRMSISRNSRPQILQAECRIVGLLVFKKVFRYVPNFILKYFYDKSQ